MPKDKDKDKDSSTAVTDTTVKKQATKRYDGHDEYGNAYDRPIWFNFCGCHDNILECKPLWNQSNVKNRAIVLPNAGSYKISSRLFKIYTMKLTLLMNINGSKQYFKINWNSWIKFLCSNYEECNHRGWCHVSQQNSVSFHNFTNEKFGTCESLDSILYTIVKGIWETWFIYEQWKSGTSKILIHGQLKGIQ